MAEAEWRVDLLLQDLDLPEMLSRQLDAQPRADAPWPSRATRELPENLHR